MSKPITWLCLVMAAATAFANTPAPAPLRDVKFDAYVQEHLPLVRKYALEAGIPPSIMLAIALHESRAGQSKLAKEANNHFGVKAKRNWSGPTYPLKDDDRDANGNLTESDFRKYATKEESFADFPRFLKSNPRYSFLFKLPPHFYTSWANALKMAGYATDEQYADRLIETIEKYELYRYDPAPPAVQPDLAPSQSQSSAPVAATTDEPFSTTAAAPAQPSKQPSTSMFEAAQNLRRNPGSPAPQPETAAPAHPLQEAETFQAPPCPWPTQRLETMQATPVFKSGGPRI